MYNSSTSKPSPLRNKISHHIEGIIRTNRALLDSTLTYLQASAFVRQNGQTSRSDRSSADNTGNVQQSKRSQRSLIKKQLASSTGLAGLCKSQKRVCVHRESNPGHWLGKPICYRYTMHARKLPVFGSRTNGTVMIKII